MTSLNKISAALLRLKTASVWGREAVVQNHPDPSLRRKIVMASVSRILPKSQAQAGTVHWLNECIKRGEREVFMEVCTITPGLASVLLNMNPNNRPLSESRVRRFAKDMIDGRWEFNGEPIIVAADGDLNDGQHRLSAIISSNSPQALLLVFGVTRESRLTVDQGGGRTAGHYLGMEGVKNANLCASIARIVLGFEASDGTKTRSDASNSEVFQRSMSDEGVRDAAHYAASVNKYARGILTATYIGAAYYLFAEIDEGDARKFLDQVCVGEDIKRGDPAFAVRRALTGHETSGTHSARKDAMEVVFRGWNAFRQGRKLNLAKTLGVLPALV